MATWFPEKQERRYTSVKRRYLNEYFFDSRRRIDHPNVSIGYATLRSARDHASRAVDRFQCTTVRIFDRITGQYVFTYKAVTHGRARGVMIHEGCVR